VSFGIARRRLEDDKTILGKCVMKLIPILFSDAFSTVEVIDLRTDWEGHKLWVGYGHDVFKDSLAFTWRVWGKSRKPSQDRQWTGPDSNRIGASCEHRHTNPLDNEFWRCELDWTGS
jgi:hypothetical protein